MEYTYGQLCRYLQGSPVAMKTPTCRLATGWPPYCLCYCPAVFFCHPCLITCSFISRKIQRAFQKIYVSFFFNSLNCVNLKLHNLKFCKSGSDHIISTIVWGVMLCVVCTGTRVTEETDASIFTHSEHKKQQVPLKICYLHTNLMASCLRTLKSVLVCYLSRLGFSQRCC
jgi:hypothetical protein